MDVKGKSSKLRKFLIRRFQITQHYAIYKDLAKFYIKFQGISINL